MAIGREFAWSAEVCPIHALAANAATVLLNRNRLVTVFMTIGLLSANRLCYRTERLIEPSLVL